MKIKLIRHGESEANKGIHIPHREGDYCANLTDRGKDQSKKVGCMLGANLISNALIYCSPYWRTRQTLGGIIQASGLDKDSLVIYEDPRLREVERGYFDNESQLGLRKTHGWFYYRHQGGESPADCYDRVSSFLDSLMRNVERKKAKTVIIVAHGMVIRCFVMRFLHLTVEQFNNMKDPSNGSIITITPACDEDNPVFCTKKWAVSGLRLRS